jgi:hypothetical protein
MNYLDLADALCDAGYEVDYDTGLVDYRSMGSPELLITLYALDKLEIHHDLDGRPEYYIPHLAVCDMQSYCDQFPNDPQCKCYDV